MENKYKSLILEIIKKNERFPGNEEFLDAIYEDVLIRLGGILDSINDEAIIRGYIERIAKLSIITVSRAQSKSVQKVENLAQDNKKTSVVDYYKVFSYEPALSEKNPPLALLQDIEAGIMALEKEYPTKEIIKLYRLRYQEKKSLDVISEELNISQAQAAERLFEITALVKRICDNEMSQV